MMAGEDDCLQQLFTRLGVVARDICTIKFTLESYGPRDQVVYQNMSKI